MLKNYFLITIRNLYKHKFYAGINIAGLAVGLASCLLILLYVTDELSYDRFHQNSDRLFRVNWDFKWNDDEGVAPGTPPPLAAALEREIPGVQATTRIYPAADMAVRYEDDFFNETRILGVEPNFFDFFSFAVIAGDPGTALSGPGKAILTEATAEKYFGKEPAVGRTIQIGESGEFLGRPYSSEFKVTGVVRTPPHNSHIKFDLLTSMASHPQVAFFDWSWVWMQVVTYAMLEPAADIERMEAQIVDMVATHAPKAFERIGFSFEDLLSGGGRWNFVFQPLEEIYLNADIGNRLGPVGNATYLMIFSVVAAFILLIACINFMNLATARATQRAREVGVRKVLGSLRRNLMTQFMTEAVFYSILAMLLAIGLTEALLGPFRHLTGKPLELNLTEPWWLPVAMVLLTVLVGTLAGSYPSLYLSAFRPVEVLKGRVRGGLGGQRLRNGLVVVQFAVSITLIICTLVVHQQMQFFRQKELGFQREGVVVVSNHNDRLQGHAETYKEILRSKPQVVEAAISTGVPPYSGFYDYFKIEESGDEQRLVISYMVDDDFAAAMGIEIVRGRGFSREFKSSADDIVVNETAVKRFGWDDPIGKTIHYPSWGTYTVVGVMNDFNFLTLHEPIVPFALLHRSSQSYDIPDSYVIARIQLDDIAGALSVMKDAWQDVAPGAPFEYTFLEDTLARAYETETRLGTLFLIFAGLAILIACLGLLGLAAFTAEKRTKEIGIRKTLGASVARILLLLTGDFTRWILIANVIAWPVAWYAMENWLQGFAYRVELGFAAFLLAAAIALLIAIGAVGYQAVKAALSDPVKALRYE